MFYRCNSRVPSVTVATSVANSTEIPYGTYAGGMVFVPTGFNATLTYYVASELGGTYVPAYDEDVVQVTQVVTAGKAYSIPAALYGAPALKIVGNGAGTVSVTMKT